jgi:hypothetical protein
MRASPCAGSSCRSCAPAFHRIRHFGFLANSHRAARLALCRRLLARPGSDHGGGHNASPGHHRCAQPCRIPDPEIWPGCGSLVDPFDAAPRAARSCSSPPMTLQPSISGILAAPAPATRARKVVGPRVASTTFSHRSRPSRSCWLASPRRFPPPRDRARRHPEHQGTSDRPLRSPSHPTPRDTPPMARAPPQVRSIRLL